MKNELVTLTFLISCSNYDYIISALHRKGVKLIDIDRKNQKSLLLTVPYSERQKIFAICKNMCYNVKIVRYNGMLGFLVYALYRLPFVIGAVVFTLCCYFYGNVILSIDCTGSGAVFQSEIIKSANNLGIKKYVYSRDLNLKNIEKELLKSNELLTFVSCSVKGNRLIIFSSAAETPPYTLSQEVSDMISDTDGTIKEITVLRGTPLFKVGDKVSVGDVLVGAYNLYNEEKFSTYIVASIKIECEKIYNFSAENPTETQISAFKMTALYGYNEDAYAVVEKVKGQVIVTVHYIRVIHGGQIG